MNKIGFTGSRRGMTAVQKKAFLEMLASVVPIELHHGDCVGADENAHDLAREFEAATGKLIKIVVHPPSNDKLRAYAIGDKVHKAKPYLERNHDIVDETEILWAFPNKDVTHIGSGGGGTWSTIRYARSVGKPVVVTYLNGKQDRL